MLKHTEIPDEIRNLPNVVIVKNDDFDTPVDCRDKYAEYDWMINVNGLDVSCAIELYRLLVHYDMPNRSIISQAVQGMSLRVVQCYESIESLLSINKFTIKSWQLREARIRTDLTKPSGVTFITSDVNGYITGYEEEINNHYCYSKSETKINAYNTCLPSQIENMKKRDKLVKRLRIEMIAHSW